MKLDESKYSIANIRDMIGRKDLSTNKEYQRSPGLWPNGARSYFIDTILAGFPFPKIYFHEFLEKATKKTRTQIVDGQQRVTTIIDFLNNNFVLGKNAGDKAGMFFRDLDDDIQDQFLSYTISVDVIRDADRAQILEMFRRMNAYTLPLNSAEKRHAEFFGEFKDFVNRVLSAHASIFTEWGIYSSRQIVRMADAEFIADLVLAFEEGVISTSDKRLADLYRKYELQFDESEQFFTRINEIFTFIVTELGEIRDTFMTKPYAFYALCCALYHNMYGLPRFEVDSGLKVIGAFASCDRQVAVANLIDLAAAHEGKDMSRFPLYVEAMSGGTNRERQRYDRIAQLSLALRRQL